MAINVKWLVRAGALFVMIGFFLPTMTLSASGFGITLSSNGFSFANLAAGNGAAILYLIFLGMLLTLAAPFLSHFRQDWLVYIPIVEAGGIVLSMIVLVGTLIQAGNNTTIFGYQLFQFQPLGVLIFLAGYGLAIAGVLVEFIGGNAFMLPIPNYWRGRTPGNVNSAPDWQNQQRPVSSLPEPIVFAQLEVTSGNLPVRLIQVTAADFSIGRGSANDLNIPDKKVSRAHVRLRYAQGAWFIQDQNSAIGTYVNDQRVEAGRLNAGDQLKIGDAVFIFRC